MSDLQVFPATPHEQERDRFFGHVLDHMKPFLLERSWLMDDSVQLYLLDHCLNASGWPCKIAGFQLLMDVDLQKAIMYPGIARAIEFNDGHAICIKRKRGWDAIFAHHYRQWNVDSDLSLPDRRRWWPMMDSTKLIHPLDKINRIDPAELQEVAAQVMASLQQEQLQSSTTNQQRALKVSRL